MTLLSSLVKEVVIPTEQIDVLTCRLEDHLNAKLYLGYLFETYVDNVKAQKIDGSSLADEAVMRESCIRFITTLVDQMRQRLPDHTTVLQETSLLSVQNALCVVKEPLIFLLEAMAVPPETIKKIQNQWSKITLHALQSPFQSRPPNSPSKYRPRSRSGVKFTPIRTPAAKTRSLKSCFNYELPAAVVRAIGSSATYVQQSHLSGPSTSTSGFVEMLSDDDSGDEDLDVFFVDL
ncbi:hypothetical protein HPB48_004527 [Haemaphysalis longicornis]|uniref:Uncharacterized protein n=1 Tax=Haemaphysalis longicornis TaxID=44386 RepID=A0A9J6FZY3_HAELO|nr:hypothetical protein HPB48_004527 [Haemaphysalis longicornis]